MYTPSNGQKTKEKPENKKQVQTEPLEEKKKIQAKPPKKKKKVDGGIPDKAIIKSYSSSSYNNTEKYTNFALEKN